MRCFTLLLLCLLLSACVKHDAAVQFFEPKPSFSGRLLVMGQTQRFQLEIDWRAAENGGVLRLTHGLSGRIVDVEWQGEVMRWHDNAKSMYWQPLSVEKLLAMGVVFPPWTMARIFTGDLPHTMKTKNNRLWQGTWDGSYLTIRWASKQQRVELVDLQHGRRAVVVFDD